MNSARTYAGMFHVSTQGVIGGGLISMHFGFWLFGDLGHQEKFCFASRADQTLESAVFASAGAGS
jgi:hypothetical protein